MVILLPLAAIEIDSIEGMHGFQVLGPSEHRDISGVFATLTHLWIPWFSRESWSFHLWLLHFFRWWIPHFFRRSFPWINRRRVRGFPMNKPPNHPLDFAWQIQCRTLWTLQVGLLLVYRPARSTIWQLGHRRGLCRWRLLCDFLIAMWGGDVGRGHQYWWEAAMLVYQ